MNEQLINDLIAQINELKEDVQALEFQVARRDVIIRFLVDGRADRDGESII